MKQWLKTLFSDSGDVSMIRVLSLTCVLSAVAIAIVGLCTDKHPLESVAILCGTFLTTGIGGKVVQKIVEKDKEI